MLGATLKCQRSTSIPRAMLKTIFGTIFDIFEDMLIRLTSFCRGSHCPLKSLQPFLCLLYYWFYANANIGKHFNLVSKFENRPIHHIGKNQGQCP